MPTISEFFGILILMYYRDHAPPHFHAKYGEFEALIQISPLVVLKSNLPPKNLGLVIEWGHMHQQELMEEWNNAAANKKLQKIPPLQ
jgi:hypothetical protein